jgi:hypothetical protein
MPQSIPFESLLTLRDPVRGTSEAYALTSAHQVAFADALRLGDRTDPVDPASEDVDPFHLLALVRRLLPEALVISGAPAQELVYLEQVRFVRQAVRGEKVVLAATFVEATPDEQEGLVAVRLAVALQTTDEEIPLLVAEVVLLCGDPNASGG